MQRAATGLAVAISNFLGRTYGARVVLLIGSGDNGGDALYAGARLARRGAQVIAVLLSSTSATRRTRSAAGSRWTGRLDRRHPDRRRRGRRHRRDRWSPRAAPGRAERSSWPDQYGVPIVAVDMPSGVDVDTGETPEPHVRAALTVTFGTHKICHLDRPRRHRVRPGPPGRHRPRPPAGRRRIPPSRRRPRPLPGPARRVRQVLPRRPRPDGRLGAVPGCRRHRHRWRSRRPVGMLRYVGPDAVAAAVRAAHPEIVAGEGRVQAWAIGSGLGDDSTSPRSATCSTPKSPWSSTPTV